MTIKSNPWLWTSSTDVFTLMLMVFQQVLVPSSRPAIASFALNFAAELASSSATLETPMPQSWCTKHCLLTDGTANFSTTGMDKHHSDDTLGLFEPRRFFQ